MGFQWRVILNLSFQHVAVLLAAGGSAGLASPQINGAVLENAAVSQLRPGVLGTQFAFSCLCCLK